MVSALRVNLDFAAKDRRGVPGDELPRLRQYSGRQRTDPAHVLASVRTLSRMEFAGETLRAALEALAAAAPGWLAPLTGASRADRYGARTGSCRFPEGEDCPG